jgi:Ca2+-dependent lipid-binding protein
VLDKSNPYFKIEKLNKDLQLWEVLWKSEVVKDTLNPTWMEARLPLQLLCNDDQANPLKITIWDYEKHSTSHDLIGFVESTVAELVAKAKEKTIPVMLVKREKRKWFGGSKLKTVGLLKVLKASVIAIPSMLQ